MTEAEIEEKIGDLLRSQSNPTIALLARPGYVAVRVTAKGADERESMDLIEKRRGKSKKDAPFPISSGRRCA